jgi:Uma2 family endonuclease
MSLPQPNKRPLSVEEFHWMGRVGIIGAEERVELQEGEIYTMPPIGPSHAGSVNAASESLRERGARRYLVSVQNPVRLDEFSEPIPDIALLRWRDDFYRTAHPTPADIFLVIEVADSTLKSDRSGKIPLYARAGIPEAWLVNITGRRVELHAEPVNGVYQVVRVFQRGETVQAHTLADLRLGVAEILG